MKQAHTRSALVKAGLLGMGALLGGTALIAPVSAAPNRDVKNARRDVKQARKEARQDRRDVRRADTPEERRDAREELRDSRQNVRREQRDLRQERREAGQRPNRNQPRGSYQNGGYYQGGGYYQNDGYYQPRGAYQGRGSSQTRTSSFVGTVTKVRSNQSFDVRVGGSNFNIYTNARLPRQLSKNDQVRVYGVRYGVNDIRNASVSLLSNR